MQNSVKNLNTKFKDLHCNLVNVFMLYTKLFLLKLGSLYTVLVFINILESATQNIILWKTHICKTFNGNLIHLKEGNITSTMLSFNSPKPFYIYAPKFSFRFYFLLLSFFVLFAFPFRLPLGNQGWQTSIQKREEKGPSNSTRWWWWQNSMLIQNSLNWKKALQYSMV